MAALLLYSLKSALVLMLLYVPYTLLLRRESFFRFNRAMLLVILLLSLLLPLCNFSALSLDRQPVVQAAQVQLIEMGLPVTVLPQVELTVPAPRVPTGPTLFGVLSLLYIIGMLGVLVVRVYQLDRLRRGVGRGSLWTDERDGIRIHCQAAHVSPFSWMHDIVISQADYDENGREILLHETGHIRNRHSWDVLMLTVVEMLQWWNPLVYMLGISLRDVHEYEADAYVLRQGVSASEYQMLLIKKAVGSGSYAFANSFNHSLTKKRITMMCRKCKSSAWMRARGLYVIPAAALALSAFATPKIVSPVEGAVNNLAGKVTENSLNTQGPELVFQQDSIWKKPSVRAEFPGGDVELMKFIQKNMHYPKLCQYFGVQGRTIFHFVIEKDGSLSNVKKVRGAGKKLSQADVERYRKNNPDATEQPKAGDELGDLFEAEGVRLLQSMPRWTPARDEQGHAVRSDFYIPMVFRLK